MQGVCPLGAQVRRTFGISRKPLSSTNTRWAPRRAAFFYPGPFVPLPPGDGDLVALDRPPLGLLATPAQRGQHLPDMRGVIAHAELLVNQFGHPRQRPKIGPVPGVQCPASQQLHQLTLLPGGQSRRAPRGGFGVQPSSPFPTVCLPPAKARTQGRPDPMGDDREGLARFQQLNSAPTALLQLLGRSKWSNESSLRRSLEFYALFMQDSIRARHRERARTVPPPQLRDVRAEGHPYASRTLACRSRCPCASLLSPRSSRTRRSRSALPMTDTELNVIAALAMMGLSSRPVHG